MASKVDFKKTLEGYQAKNGVFSVLDIPECNYLMIDGHGDPNTAPAYIQALETLYPVAYKLKFFSKTELERDYVVPPLEGLWWAEDMKHYTTNRDKNQWDWTMMLFVPEWITSSMFSQIIELVGQKNRPVSLDELRFENLAEKTCVQTLHLGAYEDEAETLRKLHEEFAPTHRLNLTGKHHEIYLSDPRRTAPEKLRTILRQPVQYIAD